MRSIARLLLLALATAPGAAIAANPIARVTTPLGHFDIELCAEISERCLGVAPTTVENFLGYVDAGAYEGSFVHRRVFNFVIQGGSFYIDDANSSDPIQSIAPRAPVVSEFNQSNERGTVSVPLPSDPPTSTNPCDTNENAGTSGWFVNLRDNSSLDCGLFTVFGVVTDDGMQVVDAINQLATLNGGGAFSQLPLLDTYDCQPVNNVCTGDVLPFLVYSTISRVPEAGAFASAVVALLTAAARARRHAR